jgi:hypothetical protein
MVSASLNFLGGAKSRDVKVPDFLSKCLSRVSLWLAPNFVEGTYGLGIGASSSNALTIGANEGTAGE